MIGGLINVERWWNVKRQGERDRKHPPYFHFVHRKSKVD
jgi:hypothetical protein